MKKANLILTSDWHLSLSVPRCRRDDYQAAMRRKVDFILDAAAQHQCPIVIAGDVFDRWDERPMSWIIRKVLWEASEVYVYTIPGQHELPNHRFDEVGRSVYDVLEASKTFTDLSNKWMNMAGGVRLCGFPWAADMDDSFAEKSMINVAVCHRFVYPGKAPFPNCKGNSAVSLLKKHPKFDLIVTGDNHQSFSVKYKGRMLVNPGAMMRRNADEADVRPRFTLWYADENAVKWVEWPVDPDAVSDEHLRASEDRDAGRASAYVQALKDGGFSGVNFRENMEQDLRENPDRPEVEELIWRSFGD